MKIPRVNSSNISSAVSLTVKSSRQIIKGTKKYVEQAGHKGKCAMAGAVMLSSVLSSQLISNKITGNGLKIDRDIFVKTKPIPLKESAYIGSRLISAIKTERKKPVIKYAKDVTLAGEKDRTLPQDINTKFNQLLITKKNKKNPLKNKAGVFIQKAEKYNINPALLMSISMTESARGSSNASINKNNVGGIMKNNRLRRFNKVEDCIDVMAETIANHHYKRNIDTLEELAYSGKYCDKKVAKKWMKDVMFYMQKLI